MGVLADSAAHRMLRSIRTAEAVRCCDMTLSSRNIVSLVGQQQPTSTAPCSRTSPLLPHSTQRRPLRNRQQLQLTE